MNLKLSGRFLISNGALLFSLVGLTVLGVMYEGSTGGPIALLATVGCGAASLGMLWSMRKYQRTRISEQGVEQATLNGPVFVPWNEVLEVRMYSGSFILESPRGTVMVYPKAYEQAVDVSEFVVGHLREVMAKKGARVADRPTTFS